MASWNIFSYVANLLGKNKYIRNLTNASTGAHLTDAQREANAFEAEQAQKQMDFQERMSNTAYQRQVADMKAAGVNPALAFGGTANGASVSSGAMAGSESPGQPTLDPVSLLQVMSQVALLRSQKRNIDADTDKKRADIDMTKQNIVESNSRIQQIKANVRSLGLSADAQEIVNNYLDRKEYVALQNMTLEGDKLAAEWSEIQQKIANLKADEKKSLQDVIESTERVNLLLSQQALNASQIHEIEANIARINQETDNLVKTGVLTQKDIDFYEWNHGEGITLPTGAKLGVRSFNRVDKSKN